MEILEELKEREEYSSLFTSYVEELRQRSNKSRLNDFAVMRDFPLETVEECGIFYVGEMSEMLLPKYMDTVDEFGVISNTNKKPIFKNRYAIPILTEDGKVENLVGYSKEADERYLYGTARYYRRRDTYWGLENINLAYELGYAIITEGITDAIRIRSLGFKNAFARCGTHDSDEMLEMMNRCRYGVIEIPDRDLAGLKALKKWDYLRSVTMFIPVQYKDVDSCCYKNEENKELIKEALNQLINWLVTEEHRGKKFPKEEVTVF